MAEQPLLELYNCLTALYPDNENIKVWFWNYHEQQQQQQQQHHKNSSNINQA